MGKARFFLTKVSANKKIGEVMSELATRLRAVEKNITDAAKAADRNSTSVTLVAVGKIHGQEKIREALLAGQRVFGENRVQEAHSLFALVS